ncbi:hypothetical protein WG901_08715 [Novosphingobium sp. PS1R-30]|uniref:Uncharacterized protein n=1 Tax=Novosphingobium anseongense TaxID=3133436 RepID=A0ABU8RVA7_9SPHN
MANPADGFNGLSLEYGASAAELDAAAHDVLNLDVGLRDPSPFGESAIDDGALHRIAGREDLNQLSYAEQVAGVTKNSIGDNSTTGSAQISDNAFQNLSGLSILNVNTGNNVAINAAMNVNISFNAQP